MNVTVLKLSLVDFPVSKSVLALPMFLPIQEIALVFAAVLVLLPSCSIGPVLSPRTTIYSPIGDIVEGACAVKGVVFEHSLVIAPVRVNKQTHLACSHSSLKTSLVKDTVNSVQPTKAMRSAFFPLSMVETSRHGC